jgi:GNAT superfamily N-acetyltransferase
MTIATALPDFVLRTASINDCQQILDFIKELAEYEKLSHEVVATVATLEETLFGEVSYAQAVLGEYQGRAVGYALFFHNFSTFTGRPGIYLEDIYVQPEMRGKGFGKCLLSYLAKLAVEKRCSRVEWSVLDWNEPSIQFYRSIGAAPMDGWTIQRLDGDELTKFANEFVG